MHFFESAGFGGLCAVLAGALAFLAARSATRERRRNDDLAHWWERFTWTVGSVAADDELRYRLLSRLADAAHRLGDRALVEYMQEFTVQSAHEAFGQHGDWTVGDLSELADDLAEDAALAGGATAWGDAAGGRADRVGAGHGPG